MSNYIFTIAKQNIKKDQKQYQYIFFAIMLTIFVIVSANILSSSFQYAQYLHNSYLCGQWDMAFLNQSDDDYQQLLQDSNITHLGKIYYGGEVVENNQNLGYIGYYDEEAMEMANIHLLQGRLAENENEIVVEAMIQEELDLTINQVITIHYNHHSKDYQIVGIIDNYSTQWLSRGLSFITTSIESNEMDLLVCGKYVNQLWNQYSEGICNTSIHPEYQIMTASGYTNESPLFQNMLEIIIVSLIVIIATMISSLQKRESQFVLLRSIGMTYQQLQKLILYEGYILAIIATAFAIFFGILISFMIVFFISVFQGIELCFQIQWMSLVVELLLCFLSILLGIFLPTLTVYDLPLTRKNGEFVYHSYHHQKQKPTYFNLMKTRLTSHKGFSILMIILTSFIMTRANTSINLINQLQTTSLKQTQSGQYIWNDYNYEEMNTIINNPDITIQSARYTYISTDNNQSALLACIQHDEYMKELISYQDINNQEAIILTYEDHPQQLSQTIQLLFDWDEYNHKIYKELNIVKIIPIDKNKASYYFQYTFDDFCIIVNEETYADLTGEQQDNYYLFDTKKDIAKISLHNCFIEMIKKYDLYSSHLYGFHTTGSNHKFINIDIQESINLYNENESKINNFIYSSLLLVSYLVILFMMMLLLSYKEKRELGLLNIIGMTKKQIFLMFVVEAVMAFIFSILISFIYWYVFECSAKIYQLYESLQFYCLSLLFAFIMELFCHLYPIYHLLKRNTLDIINNRNY